jgi:hypothetical protein
MAIALLWMDPWVHKVGSPANNFVVSMKISGRRSLLNYGESTSPLHQIAKMTMEKIHLLIQDSV